VEKDVPQLLRKRRQLLVSEKSGAMVKQTRYNQSLWNRQSLDVMREKCANGKFIELNGHSTHYIEKGEGPAVILVHGWFHDSQMWNRNIDVLAMRFKVYAIDLWGFGYSTREIMDWGYPLYASQLIEFMDALSINRASLVGQSMGAGASMLLCTQYPGRVDKLVLVSPAGLPNSSSFIDKLALRRYLKELLLNLDNSRRLILKTMFIYNENSIAAGYFEELTRFHEVSGTNEVLLAILRKNFFGTLPFKIDCLSAIGIPILIVCGRHDKSISLKLVEKMHGMLKGSRLEVIEQSAHCANYEQPDRFNKVVTNFLHE